MCLFGSYAPYASLQLVLLPAKLPTKLPLGLARPRLLVALPVMLLPLMLLPLPPCERCRRLSLRLQMSRHNSVRVDCRCPSKFPDHGAQLE